VKIQKSPQRQQVQQVQQQPAKLAQDTKPIPVTSNQFAVPSPVPVSIPVFVPAAQVVSSAAVVTAPTQRCHFLFFFFLFLFFFFFSLFFSFLF